MNKNRIVLNKISVEINKKKILSNISFSVSSNKPLCILGRGASGKSTILKSIVGLVPLEKGDILIDGISIKEPKNFKKKLDDCAVVFQKDALFDSLQVWQNIMFKSLQAKKKDELIESSFKLLKKVGLNRQDAFLYPSELSGGMKKRVAIARAISHNPKILLMDEPTAGLDPIKTNMIFDIIKSLTTELSVNLIVVTSDVKAALKYFSKAIVLEEKKIHWEGTTDQARKKPTKYLRELFFRV